MFEGNSVSLLFIVGLSHRRLILQFWFQLEAAENVDTLNYWCLCFCSVQVFNYVKTWGFGQKYIFRFISLKPNRWIYYFPAVRCLLQNSLETIMLEGKAGRSCNSYVRMTLHLSLYLDYRTNIHGNTRTMLFLYMSLTWVIRWGWWLCLENAALVI